MASPHIRLTFMRQIGENDKPAPGFREDAHASFTIEWLPGVKVGNHCQLDDLEYFSGDDLQMKHLKSKAIFKLCPKPEEMRNLIALTFESSGHIKSQLPDDSFLTGLNEDIKQCFDTLVKQDKCYVVLYFLTPNNTEVAHYTRHCLSYLQRFVAYKTHPLSPYMDQNGEVNLSIHDTPTIKTISNGIFQKALHEKDKKAGEEPKYITLPYQDRWSTSRQFHVYAGLPAVRDAQFSRGQYAHLVDSVHHCFLQAFPLVNPSKYALSQMGKKAKESTFFAYIRQHRHTEGNREESPQAGTEVELEFDNSYTGLTSLTPRLSRRNARGEPWNR